MEAILHYLWQHRQFPLGKLRTTAGVEVEVIDVGLHNTDAGPDFFNAKIRLGGQLWVGNVELHVRSSDWFRHRHEQDARYNNVVLHVVGQADCEVQTESGYCLPQLELTVPSDVDGLLTRCDSGFGDQPPCKSVIPQIEPLYLHGWLDALLVERLETKSQRVVQWVEQSVGDWEQAFFIALARAFGFGKNADVFERWAKRIDAQQIGKHRDQIFQVEAFFFGQAGFLEDESLPPARRDDYFCALQAEYRFLQHKFQLEPLAHTLWKFLRMRPQNFPHRRLAEIANLYAFSALNFSKIRATKSLDDVRKLLNFSLKGYWKDHYLFGQKNARGAKKIDTEKKSKKLSEIQESDKSNSITEFSEKDSVCELSATGIQDFSDVDRTSSTPREEDCLLASSHDGKRSLLSKSSPDLRLSAAAIDLLIVNAVIPTLFAFGRQQQPELAERALGWLTEIKPERNRILRQWAEAGVRPQHAADAQALLQLHEHYCERKDCLRCRIGVFFLRKKTIPSEK